MRITYLIDIFKKLIVELAILSLTATFDRTDENFEQLCQTHETWKIERTATGKLIIMPPTEGETGIKNADLMKPSIFPEHKPHLPCPEN